MQTTKRSLFPSPLQLRMDMESAFHSFSLPFGLVLNPPQIRIAQVVLCPMVDVNIGVQNRVAPVRPLVPAMWALLCRLTEDLAILLVHRCWWCLSQSLATPAALTTVAAVNYVLAMGILLYVPVETRIPWALTADHATMTPAA